MSFSLGGNRSSRIGETDHSGVYLAQTVTLDGQSRQRRFAVNVPLEDSDLAILESQELADARAVLLRHDPLHQRRDQLAFGQIPTGTKNNDIRGLGRLADTLRKGGGFHCFFPRRLFCGTDTVTANSGAHGVLPVVLPLTAGTGYLLSEVILETDQFREGRREGLIGEIGGRHSDGPLHYFLALSTRRLRDLASETSQTLADLELIDDGSCGELQGNLLPEGSRTL